MDRHGARRGRPELVALGQTVRRRRTEKGWTLDALAAEAGISRRTLLNLESGAHSVGVGSVFAVSAALGVRSSVLIEESEADTE